MRHLLFYLTFGLCIFSLETLKAQVVRPCITVNGVIAPANATPKNHYKCAKAVVKLAVKNCGTASIDPSEFTYSWVNTSSGSFTYTNPEVNTDEAGIWVVTVSYTDPIFGTNYTGKDTLELINYPAVSPALQINNGNTVAAHCPYESVTFNATTGSQFLTNSYRWFLNTTATIDTSSSVVGTGSTVTLTIPTVKWVTVVATDTYGCRNTDNIYAPLQSSPAPPNLGPDTSKCPGTSVTLSTAYNTNYTYYWNGSNTGVAGPNSNTYIASTPGKYWVAVSGGALSPCRIADTIWVYDYTAPAVDAGNDTSLCYYASGPLHAHAQGSGPFTYSWTPTTYFPGGSTSADPVIDFNGAALGTFPISVKVTDIHGCYSTATVNATHLGQGTNPYMFVNVDPLTICEGTTKAFNTNATTTYSTTLTYQWSPSSYLSNSTTSKPTVDLNGSVAINTPVNYTLQVTDSKGCYLTVNTSATLVPAVDVTLDFNDTSICLGNSIALEANATGGTGALAYAWSPATDLSNAAIADPVSTPTANRNYTVTVTDTKGCSDNASVTVKPVIVTVNLVSTDTSGYNIEPMVLTPQVGGTTYKYQWTNKTTLTALGTNKSQTVTETATYVVLATDSLSGCQASDSINVTIQVGNPRLIYVPNVFNPASSNPDNKVVKVYGTAVQETDFAFRIYNKWGEMIYETTSFTDANTQGWSGGYKSNDGAEQHLAVYTYSLHGRYFDGQEFDKTGSITLVR